MHNIKKRLVYTIFLLSSLLFFGGSFFLATPAYAATTAEWVNTGIIRVTSDDEGVANGNYIDVNTGDSTSNYVNGCDFIDLTGDSTGTLTNRGANRNGICDNNGPTINLTIAGNPADSGPARCFDSENFYEEIDCPPDQRSSGVCYIRSTRTTGNSGGTRVDWDGSRTCDEVLALQQQAEQEEEDRAEQQTDREGLGPECLDTRDGLNEWMEDCPSISGVSYVNGQCYEIFETSRSQNRDGVRVQARTVLCDVAAATSGTEAPRREATEEGPPSCLNEGGDNSWLICPALNGLDGAISYLDNQVNSLLFVPEAYYNDENQQLESIWGSFRDLAYILLIPTLLIMVIGTALGFQFLDAYTVKRALPRLFVAVIFIAISLPLLRFLVTSVNEIGQGVYGLISSVGSNDGEPFTLQGLFDPNPVQDTGASILFVAGGVLVIKFLLPFLLLLALGVLLQIAAIFILLAFRQFLIIALLAIAPLAILAWIFPGNDKPWKLWWGSLWKLLLIYPIIMALLAIGRVFAEIVQGAPGTQGLVEVIIKLVAYIGPFFLIPAAFKYAGGVFANIAGMVNDKERGPLDRLRKARGQSLQDKHQGAMDATGKQGKGVVGSSYRRLANFGKNGSFTPTKAGRNRWKEQEQLVKEAAADKLLKEGGGRAFNDDDASNLLKVRGMTKSTFVEKYAALDDNGDSTVGAGKRFATEEDRVKAAQSALARAELATGAKVGTDAMAVGAQKFRTAMTNTAYRSGPEGLKDLQDDLVQMQQDGLISEGDAAGWMKSNKGRTDFSSNGFVDTINFAKGDISADQQLKGAFKGADPREVVGGHQKALESFAAVAEQNFKAAVAEQNNAHASGDTARIAAANKSLDYAAADVAGIYDTLGSVSPKKASEFSQTVMEQGVQTLGGRQTTVRAMVEQSRSRPADVNGVQPFLERRREYGSQVPPELRGEGPLPPPEQQG